MFEFTLTGLIQNMAIQALVMKIGLPLIDYAFGGAVRRIIPEWVWEVIETARPDAMSFSIGAQAGYSFFDVTGAWTLLVSTHNLEHAWYGSLGATIGAGTGWQGSLSGSVGLVFDCSNSTQYTGSSVVVTVPMKILPEKWRRMLLEQFIAATPLAQELRTSLGKGPHAWSPSKIEHFGIQSAIDKFNNIFDTFMSISWSGGWGVEVSAGASLSVGNTGKWSIGYTYAWQQSPDEPVDFKLSY
jgi:hypothetical protein